MDFLTTLQNTGILQIAVVIGIVWIMARFRKLFLDRLIVKIEQKSFQYLVLTITAFLLSVVLTSINMLTDFNFLNWIKVSFFNWIFSYIFHDAIKNLIFKENK